MALSLQHVSVLFAPVLVSRDVTGHTARVNGIFSLVFLQSTVKLEQHVMI